MNRALVTVAGTCLLVQMGSAVLQRRDFETPNTSTEIAKHFLSEGEFAVDGERVLAGSDGRPRFEMTRAYQLPGEPLYLAGGFSVLPQALWRFLHVPVTVLLVTAVAAVALAIAGPAAAVATGLVATLDPFIVAHGPIWDDTLLAAALEWCVLAILVSALADAGPSRSGVRPGWALVVVVAACAGWAAVTRTQSQAILGGFGLAVVTVSSARRIRNLGWAILAGVVIAVGAWGTRNSLVVGAFVPGSTHDWKTLYESNCAYTRTGILQTGVVGGFLEECSLAETTKAEALGEVERDQAYGRDARAYIRTHPVDVAETAALKLAVSLSGIDFSSSLRSPRNLIVVASSSAVLILGACGLWLFWKYGPETPAASMARIFGLLTTIFTILMLAAGPSGMRYRATLTGFFYLGAGFLLADSRWPSTIAPARSRRAVSLGSAPR